MISEYKIHEYVTTTETNIAQLDARAKVLRGEMQQLQEGHETRHAELQQVNQGLLQLRAALSSMQLVLGDGTGETAKDKPAERDYDRDEQVDETRPSRMTPRLIPSRPTTDQGYEGGKSR